MKIYCCKVPAVFCHYMEVTYTLIDVFLPMSWYPNEAYPLLDVVVTQFVRKFIQIVMQGIELRNS